MSLLEILEKVYGRTKSGKLSHHAIKFCEKYKLNIDGENSFDDMMVAFSMLSNKDKREIAIRLLLDSNRKEERNTDLLGLRKMTYKEACRKFHPDNICTGDVGVFKFIQNYKYRFWEWNGKPTKNINGSRYWSYYKYYDELVEKKGSDMSRWSDEEYANYEKLKQEYYDYREGVR